MERKWTPGPWECSVSDQKDWGAFVFGPTTTEVGGFAVSDAHLIAAAPDLYEGGEHLLNWLSASLNCPSHTWDEDQRMYAEQAIEQWRFASAKARGEA